MKQIENIIPQGGHSVPQLSPPQSGFEERWIELILPDVLKTTATLTVAGCKEDEIIAGARAVANAAITATAMILNSTTNKS